MTLTYPRVADSSEFNGIQDQPARCEGRFWRSMKELLPIFEREGVQLRPGAAPYDFVEDGRVAIDMVRGLNSRRWNIAAAQAGSSQRPPCRMERAWPIRCPVRAGAS